MIVKSRNVVLWKPRVNVSRSGQCVKAASGLTSLEDKNNTVALCFFLNHFLVSFSSGVYFIFHSPEVQNYLKGEKKFL